MLGATKSKGKVMSMGRALLRTGVATLAAIVVAVTQPAHAGEPATVSPQAVFGSITSNYDGRCVDVNLGGGTFNGQKVHAWDCNGWNNQRWSFYPDGTIRSWYDGRCLDENLGGGSFNGQKVHVWDCNGWANQRWTVFASGMIVNHYDGRCLDLNLGGGTFNGQKIHVWDCNGQPNQRWTVW